MRKCAWKAFSAKLWTRFTFTFCQISCASRRFFHTAEQVFHIVFRKFVRVPETFSTNFSAPQNHFPQTFPRPGNSFHNFSASQTHFPQFFRVPEIFSTNFSASRKLCPQIFPRPGNFVHKLFRVPETFSTNFSASRKLFPQTFPRPGNNFHKLFHVPETISTTFPRPKIVSTNSCPSEPQSTWKESLWKPNNTRKTFLGTRHSTWTKPL